jgi:hypothetical protein
MSIISDKFEKDVTNAINSAPNTTAKQGRDVKYSDVEVTRKGVTTWVEVKMSHSDNLSNPRCFFMNGKWQTTYTTPAAAEAIKILNTSAQAAKFIKDIAKYSGIPERSIIIATNKSQLKLAGCVPLHVMKSYFSQPGVNRYIANDQDKNIGDLVTQHYLKGKAAPAHYLQAGDDFYMIGNANPFKLDARIPKLAGTGDFKVRVSTRTEFYEVQAEIKIKHFSPSRSNYSVLGTPGKINPFL